VTTVRGSKRREEIVGEGEETEPKMRKDGDEETQGEETGMGQDIPHHLELFQLPFRHCFRFEHIASIIKSRH
jgi:hypothetical protein